MLGKGLESLIPQKGNGNGNAGNARNDSADLRRDPDSPQETPSIVQPQQPQPLSAPARPAAPPRPAPPVQPSSPMQPESNSGYEKPGKLEEKHVPREETAAVFHIEIEKIKPNPGQPRRNFDEEGLRELAGSIREFGFLQPLVVSRVEKEMPEGIAVEYQIIAGERRFLAAKMLGLQRVPATVRHVDLEREKLELAVIENIQREDLNPIETARAFQRLQEEFRMTQREIAAKLGKSREVVANAMRLLDLPEYARVAVEKGEISESNARLLLTVEDPGGRQHLFDDIVQNRLTTRDVRERLRHYVATAPAAPGGAGGTGARRGRPPKSSEPPLTPELKAMQESLSMDLGAPVEIHQGMANGKITITFYSEEELSNILRRLGKED